jgi:hypothetical protein
MKKRRYYNDEYFLNLIKLALSPNGSKAGIKNCAIKKVILEKVLLLKDEYGVTHEAIYSEIYFDFCRRSVMRLINNQKGSPTTFILHYVFNKLRDIEKSCSRGTFEKMHANCDAMNKIAFNLEDLNDDGNWIPQLADYETPESILIAKQTLQELEDSIGKLELSVLLGNISLDDYCKITGLCKRTFYKRLSASRSLVEDLLARSSC